MPRQLTQSVPANGAHSRTGSRNSKKKRKNNKAAPVVASVMPVTSLPTISNRLGHPSMATATQLMPLDASAFPTEGSYQAAAGTSGWLVSLKTPRYTLLRTKRSPLEKLYFGEENFGGLEHRVPGNVRLGREVVSSKNGLGRPTNHFRVGSTKRTGSQGRKRGAEQWPATSRDAVPAGTPFYTTSLRASPTVTECHIHTLSTVQESSPSQSAGGGTPELLPPAPVESSRSVAATPRPENELGSLMKPGSLEKTTSSSSLASSHPPQQLASLQGQAPNGPQLPWPAAFNHSKNSYPPGVQPLRPYGFINPDFNYTRMLPLVNGHQGASGGTPRDGRPAHMAELAFGLSNQVVSPVQGVMQPSVTPPSGSGPKSNTLQPPQGHIEGLQHKHTELRELAVSALQPGLGTSPESPHPQSLNLLQNFQTSMYKPPQRFMVQTTASDETHRHQPLRHHPSNYPQHNAVPGQPIHNGLHEPTMNNLSVQPGPIMTFLPQNRYISAANLYHGSRATTVSPSPQPRHHHHHHRSRSRRHHYSGVAHQSPFDSVAPGRQAVLGNRPATLSMDSSSWSQPHTYPPPLRSTDVPPPALNPRGGADARLRVSCPGC